mgnify:CR=1 FL=1
MKMKIIVRDPINLTQLVRLKEPLEGESYKFEFQRKPYIEDLAIFASEEEAKYAVGNLTKNAESVIMVSYVQLDD